MSKPYIEYTPAQKAEYAAKKAAERQLSYPSREPKVIYLPAPQAPKRVKRKKTGPIKSASVKDDMVLGEQLGAMLGKGAHHLFKAITGFGDYRVSQNSLLKGGMSPPQIVNSTSKGGVIIRHREYLQDISATNVWNVLAFPINPGVSSTFPWLSQIATSFEQYKLRGMVFEFKSLSSDAVLSSSTSSALGSVIMATEYNSLDNVFPNKLAMENYQFANSAKPSESFLHPIECARDQTSVSQLYVRPGPVPYGADPRLYDLGLFQIATIGMQAASGVAGELWVTYEVEFYKANLNSLIGGVMDHFDIQGIASNTTFFGTASPRFYQGSSLKSNVDFINNRCYFPSGLKASSRFLINYTIRGASALLATTPTILVQGCSIINYYENQTFSAVWLPPAGTTSATLSLQMVVNIDQPTTSNNCYWGFTSGIGVLPPATQIISDVTITELNYLASGSYQ